MGVPATSSHDEVAVAVGESTIEQPNDMRVVEVREDLALADEAMLGLGPRKVAGRNLDRDVLVVFAVPPRGAIDHAHAAASDLFDQFVGANEGADVGGDAIGTRQEAAGLVEGLQQRLHLGADVAVQRGE